MFYLMTVSEQHTGIYEILNHKLVQFSSIVDLSLVITNEICEFSIFYNRNPKAEILDAGDTLLLSNLHKPWFFHCHEHNNVPIPIPVYDFSIINTSLLC